MAGSPCRGCGAPVGGNSSLDFCQVCRDATLANATFYTTRCSQCGAHMYLSQLAANKPLCSFCTQSSAGRGYRYFNYVTYGSSVLGYPEPAPPKKLETISSREPLVGYRVWKLDAECRLGSAYMKSYKWPMRRKLCRDEFDKAGIHAVKEAKQLVESQSRWSCSIWPEEQAPWYNYQADVAGAIYMWGEVKECPLGYLAEFAYPKLLWVPEDTDPCIILQLEENYGVPCDLSPHFKKHEKKDAAEDVVGRWISYKIHHATIPPPTLP
jgi:hypothetical protein